MWLKSCHRDDPNRRPFRLPQEPTTVKRYVNHWKQFLFYVLRTSLLDESIREEVYGIHFTESQLAIIRQLLEMLKECDDDDEDGGDERCRLEEKDDDDDDYEDDEDDLYQYDSDDDDDGDEDDEEEKENENLYESDSGIDHVDDDDEEYSLLLTRIAEKVMQLSIAFITQYFPEGDDLHSPLMHFADVMGISNRTGRFNEAYNYTSYIAGLMWVIRLLMMEYALPSRAYITLNWPSHEVYENKGERLKQFHRDHLVHGSFSPMHRLISILAFGKETIKAVGRPSLLMWDSDYQGVKVKEVHLRLDAFKQFVQDGIKSTERLFQEQLFFGMNLPMVDLGKIDDVMDFIKPGYSFMKESEAKLPNGREFMFNLMKSADSSKQLIDAQGRWDTIKVREYLKAKKKGLKKLMKGITQSFLKVHFCSYIQTYISAADSRPEDTSSEPSSIETRKTPVVIISFITVRVALFQNITRPKRAQTILFTSFIIYPSQSPSLSFSISCTFVHSPRCYSATLCRHLRRRPTRTWPRRTVVLIAYPSKPVDDESKGDLSESPDSLKLLSMRTMKMKCWIVDISSAPMNLLISVGRAWNCPKSCKRNPSNDCESRLICGHGGISSSASPRHIWKRSLLSSPKMRRLARNYWRRIYITTFSHGKPGIRKGSMCQCMVWTLRFPVNFRRPCLVYIVGSREYGIIGLGF